MGSQRMYCEQPHPGGDVAAEAWCRTYHRVVLPGTPKTAEEAEDMGWTVDRHTYPWCAYLGPRFSPTRVVIIDTPANERS